ncbi:MAG: hypothetical protein A2033_14510 [Bacteroidetes bacterium GWA2_31_9]|nr:MAG: hypothetical protein A2033_14510 [Bacteroidetes bacterium GWA2_31_9]
MRLKITIIILTFVSINFNVFSQKKEIIGLPYIEVYNDTLINNNLITDICQGPNGNMYFAGSKGLLEFNGKTWKIIPGTDTIDCKHIEVFDNKLICVAGKNEFGVLKSNEKGILTYHSLRHLCDTIDLKTTVGLATNNEKVFFPFKNHLIVFSPKDFKILETLNKKNIINIYNFNNKILVFLKDTIGYLNENKLDFIGKVDNSIIFDAYYIVDSTFYAIFYPFSIYKITNKTLEKIESPLNDIMFEKASVTAIKSSNNEILLGTYSDGILRCDINGNFIQSYIATSGLPDDVIMKIFEDKEKNVWASTSTGICRLECNTPFSYFDERNGTKKAFLIWDQTVNNDLYICLLNGLYTYSDNRLNLAADGDDLYYEEFVWDNELYASSNKGLCLINKDKIESKVKMFVDDFIGLLNNKLLISSLNKYFAITKNNEKLNVNSVYFPLKKNEDYVGIIDSTYIITSCDKTLYKYKFNTTSDSLMICDSVDLTLRLPKAEFDFYKIDDKFRLSNYIQIFYYDIVKNELKEQKNIIQYLKLFRNDYDFKKDESSNLYLYSTKKFLKLTPSDNGSYVSDKTLLKIQDNLLDRLEFYSKNQYFISSKTGFIIYNPYNKYNTNIDYETVITKVICSYNKVDSLIYGGTNSDSLGNYLKNQTYFISLSYNYNNLIFDFTSTFYQNRDKLKYSYLLDGFENHWSSWSSVSFKEFTNLPEGTYTFFVKAKNIYDTESSVASYSFTILPPWYRTWLSYTLYVLVLILLIYLTIKFFTRRLIKQKEKLEQIVKQRTAEISQQKEEIQSQAEELLVINEELEKLSIVASETDNSVVIANEQGIIEWVNDGFTRMFGYTMHEFISKFGANVIAISSYDGFHEKYIESLESRSAVFYNSIFTTKTGKTIWTQTTMNPIFDNDKNLKKIILVDTDISKLKEAEAEIIQQKEEILTQKEQIEKQHDFVVAVNKELNTKNKQITDSINYAKLIQMAILPSISELQEIFPESFIFFQPRDIVSGDFYWFSKHENLVFVALIDCTGHGVPGAFMSMIGNTLLNQIVNEKAIYNPAEILFNLHKGTLFALSQRTDSIQDDGMEISICVIDMVNYQIKMASTNQSIIVIINDVLKEYDGTFYSIGDKTNELTINSFETITIPIEKDMSIYLKSDGYSDQFGGEKRQKFSNSRFVELVSNINNLNSTEQKEIVEKTFLEWKINSKQTDDVTLIGLKIS